MVRLKQFSCRRCGTTFMLRARKAYYCPECRKKHASEYVMQKRAEKDPAVKVGVGSGGNQRGRKTINSRMDGAITGRSLIGKTPIRLSVKFAAVHGILWFIT